MILTIKFKFLISLSATLIDSALKQFKQSCPTIAKLITEASNAKLENYSIFSALELIYIINLNFGTESLLDDRSAQHFGKKIFKNKNFLGKTFYSS